MHQPDGYVCGIVDGHLPGKPVLASDVKLVHGAKSVLESGCYALGANIDHTLLF